MSELVGTWKVKVFFALGKYGAYSTCMEHDFGTHGFSEAHARAFHETLTAAGVTAYLSQPRPPPPVLDYSLIEDVEVAGIDTKDCPDFVDAYIESASYDGREMTEEELEVLNADSSYVYEAVQNHLY